jgi:hypothetical protein
MKGSFMAVSLMKGSFINQGLARVGPGRDSISPCCLISPPTSAPGSVTRS